MGSFEIDGVAGIILSVFQAKERRPVVLGEEEKQKLQMNNQIFLLYFGGGRGGSVCMLLSFKL